MIDHGQEKRAVADQRSGSDAPEPAQLRADAVGLLAERAVAAGFGNRTAGAANPAPVSGSRAERYQVMLHVVRSMPGTVDVGSRAVGSPSPTPITSCTGQMAEKPS